MSIPEDTGYLGQPKKRPTDWSNQFADISANVNQSSAGYRNTGTMKVNGNTYNFVTGGSGRGSAPWGSYPISGLTTGSQRANQGYSYTKDAYPLADKFDPRVGDTRSGLLIHQSNGNATAGCIGIVGDDGVFRNFKGDLNAELARGGGKPVYMHLGADGQKQYSVGAPSKPRDPVDNRGYGSPVPMDGAPGSMVPELKMPTHAPEVVQDGVTSVDSGYSGRSEQSDNRGMPSSPSTPQWTNGQYGPGIQWGDGSTSLRGASFAPGDLNTNKRAAGMAAPAPQQTTAKPWSPLANLFKGF